MEVGGRWSILAKRRQPAGQSCFLGDTAFSNGFWRVAILAAAGIAGAASSADAATYFFWPDNYEVMRPEPRIVAQPRRKSARHRIPKSDDLAREARKPQGPLILAISIDRQVLKIYDANGYFAETPISTGTRDHPTPMGVFSIIAKHKYHRSNIYSGAPMPYMQRITWSGVAMHAGLLPGYPASHGCIRMPMNFAVKMWGWTRMGARVVIAPGELAPDNFSHPLLTTQKTPPTPVGAAEPRKNVTATAKSDKAIADVAPPSFSAAGLELKSTVGHDRAKPGASAADDATLRRQTHTADAGNALSQPTISDAISSASVSAAKADDKAIAAVAENAPPAKDGIAADSVKAASDAGIASPDVNKDQARSSDPEKAAAPKPDPVIAAAPKRTGQIAVFVSKKDGKLYVRQNFAPLFDVPVAIAPSDRPLGTHVFTAQTDKDDANFLRWSVVSMPVAARSAVRQDEDERASRRRKTTGAIEVKPAPVPDSATEALDRLTIPADAMARIAEALATGGSIIVSDQGINAGETGEGTDFIVPLR
jgi:hypothetical protein